MTDHLETVAELRDCGLRVTLQRLKVAGALRAAGGHRSADEILQLVTAADPYATLPLSTIYRTLSTLRDHRLVAEFERDGLQTYEWVATEGPHHHLVCDACRQETTLDAGLLEHVAEEIRAASGFEPHLDHTVIHGLCADCRARGER